MPGAARLGDSIAGMDGGEHCGHDPPHGPSRLSGSISSGCSPNVIVNGILAAIIGSGTDEYDSCCGMDHGRVAEGSGTVLVNGIPFARNGDKIDPHSGYANITSGSSNVIVG